MKYMDLFSGIGGFALAAEWVWGEELQILHFVEIDPFCQKVLKKHWPEVPIHDDIKTFKATQYLGRVDLLTGGFPCQPVSYAGKQRGKEDDRWLWPEMARVIEGDSTMCYLTWKISVTKRGRLLFQLVPSMPRTEEIESGSLHTMMWPTPTSQDPTGRKYQRLCGRKVLTLSGKAMLWPTPTARDWKDGSSMTVPASCLLGREVLFRCRGQLRNGQKMGRLSVSFVEWLMGFPLGWTDVE